MTSHPSRSESSDSRRELTEVDGYRNRAIQVDGNHGVCPNRTRDWVFFRELKGDTNSVLRFVPYRRVRLRRTPVSCPTVDGMERAA